jgi:predicted Zn finger-like uncharacterized protein
VFVSCDGCFAEYELDDAKIPAGGARLRCTNCDHSFVIAPPEASDLQSADDLAHGALSTEVPDEAGPDPEQESALEEDFVVGGEGESDASPEEDFVVGDEGELDASPEEDFVVGGEGESDASPEEDFDPDGESDWEFNDEVEISEPEVGGEASESDFDRDGEWVDLSSAEEVVDDLLGPAGATDADPAAAVDNLLGEADTADLQLGESSGDLASGLESPSEGLDLGDADAFDRSGGDLAADGGDSLDDLSESFDDLSDWDLFDQPAETDASAVSAGAGNLPVSAARDGARAEPRVKIAVAMADNSPTSVRWTDRILEIAGWGAVLSMLIVALVGGLSPNSSDARAPAGSWSGAGFEADQIAGRWVDNAVAGSIYVVSGRIRGAPGFDRASRKTLGIRLFDTTGREIDRAAIPLAPAVPERILRESSPAELDAFQTRRAGRIAAVGERWVSFEAVLTDLPRFADRFELQALDR